MIYIEDNEKRIEQPFFIKVLSLMIFKYNYKILLIDKTYKTNRYKIALIIISGVMLLKISYYIALYIFLKKHIRFTNSYLSMLKISMSILIY